MNGSQPHEQPLCGAKTRNGTPCRRSPAPGSNRCRLHGGASPRGLASPNYVHGTRSRYAPKSLLDYPRHADDPNLLALDDEIALVTARADALLSGSERYVSPDLLDTLEGHIRNIVRARQTSDPGAAGASINALVELLPRLSDDALESEMWDEILRLFEQRRKLVDSERRRRTEARIMISADEARAMFDALLTSIKEHCDRHTRARIFSDVQRYFSRTPE